MIEKKSVNHNVESKGFEEMAAQVATVSSDPAAEETIQMLSQKEALKQFAYVQRLTRAFLSVTWVVLIGYLIKTGVAWQDGVLVGLFLAVTYQLWNVGPVNKQ